MKNVTTAIATLTLTLALLAGGTSCGGAAALTDQLAQGSLTGSASDNGTADQGSGDNGAVSGGADDPAGHDANDDNSVDPAGHDAFDDNGIDGTGHDVGEDHGNDG